MMKAKQKVEQEIEASLFLPSYEREAWFNFAVQKFHNPDVVFLKNSYFDTPEYALISHGIGLRIRESAQGIKQTLKCVGTYVDGVHSRTEYHIDLLTPQVDLHAFASDVWPEYFDIEQIQRELCMLFETNFQRHIWQITYGNSTIEMALDEGEIFAGTKQQKICEVELELKQGTTEDLLLFKQEMQQQFHLEDLLLSKAHRGFQLLK